MSMTVTDYLFSITLTRADALTLEKKISSDRYFEGLIEEQLWEFGSGYTSPKTLILEPWQFYLLQTYINDTIKTRIKGKGFWEKLTIIENELTQEIFSQTRQHQRLSLLKEELICSAFIN